MRASEGQGINLYPAKKAGLVFCPGPDTFKDIKVSEMSFLEEIHKRDFQNAQSVNCTTAEVNGRGLFEVFGRTGNLCNFPTTIKYLRKHLIIKHEIIATAFVGNTC